ncbi:MAG: hypothetical protein PHR26_02510 [Candidatus ainarchaeum sp.]|nr:hypothetical protein [Candidatus ainarchaeum sp.]
MNLRNLISIFLIIIILLPSVSALIPNQTMSIFAVGSSENAMEAKLNISIIDGIGKIYSSIDESIVGSSTQESVKHAISTADLYLDQDIKNKYNFTIDIESNAYSVDGPSAGSAMAFLIISMFEDLNIDSISLTGSISNDGHIGDVGGILEKTIKAAEVGIKLFFIPVGNRSQMINENGEIYKVDLIDYIYDKYGMKIIEAETIDQVMSFAKKDISSIDINQDNFLETDSYFPENIKYSKAVEPMKILVDKYIIEAEKKLKVTTENLSKTDLDDSSIMQSMLEVISYAEDGLNKSKLYSEGIFLYSAANNFFVSFINLTVVDEIITNPSIISDSSTIFDIRLDDLEKKIKLVENRTNFCSLENLEWCIGAKQRITWARNKLDNIKISNYSLKGPIEKITDYSYANSWADIANDFLDVGITDSKNKFVESNYFKEIAQNKIIDIENKLMISNPEIATDSDFVRRFDSAKYNFKRGWYVTSLFDSASAFAVLETIEQNNVELFDNSLFYKNYEYLNNSLRSINSLNSKDNVWSKLFLDHAIYFYENYLYYENKNPESSLSNLKTSNSILNISNRLFEVEEVILDFYNSADIQIIIQDSIDDNLNNLYTSNNLDTSNILESDNVSQNFVIYKNDKNNYLIYFVLFFLVIITFFIFFEIYKYNHTKKEHIKQKISQLDEDLLDGKISPFTYKELRNKYLLELNFIKEKDCLKNNIKCEVKKEHHFHSIEKESELKIINCQIENLLKRKKDLSKDLSKKQVKKNQKKLSLKKDLEK